MVFCNKVTKKEDRDIKSVTILILIDGFLQYSEYTSFNKAGLSHNPYFNRWFSAMYLELYPISLITVTILILIDGFLQ